MGKTGTEDEVLFLLVVYDSFLFYDYEFYSFNFCDGLFELGS